MSGTTSKDFVTDKSKDKSSDRKVESLEGETFQFLPGLKIGPGIFGEIR